MFPGKEGRDCNFFPELLDESVVDTTYSRSLTEKIRKAILSTKFDRPKIKVWGEGPKSGVTTALRIAARNIALSVRGVKCYNLTAVPSEQERNQFICQSQRDQGIVLFADKKISDHVAKWAQSFPRDCRVCLVLAQPLSATTFMQSSDDRNQLIELSWPREDLLSLCRILNQLPFEGCCNLEPRRNSLQNAMVHVKETEYFFVLHLAASRDRYLPANEWIADQIAQAEAQGCLDILKLAAFFSLNEIGYVHESSPKIVSSFSIINCCKKKHITEIKVTHPELARVLLHQCLAGKVPSSLLFPPAQQLQRFWKESVVRYLQSFEYNGRREEGKSLIYKIFVRREEGDNRTRMVRHFLADKNGCFDPVLKEFRFPVMMLVDIIIGMDDWMWDIEHRFIHASRVLRLSVQNLYYLEPMLEYSKKAIDLARSQFDALDNLVSTYYRSISKEQGTRP